VKRAFRRAKPAEETTGIFFASDFHGADPCWRKFLGAGRHYGVDSLVMGGDLAGKALVPIARQPDGSYTAKFLGEQHEGRDQEQLDRLVAAVRFNGMYPWVAAPAEIEQFRADAAGRDELFERLILDDLRRWLALADERMPQYGIGVYVVGGNDDPWSCDGVLHTAQHVVACDDQVVRIGDHEMISCSYANTTPWHSPRELDESALYDHLHGLAEQVEDPRRAIFMFHVPPYDSGLDTAAKLDENLNVVHVGGHAVQVPVGSSAVRQIIEEYQPLLSLHGHIHESGGRAMIGRTLSINAGSEYSTGMLHGAVIRLGRDEVVSHQLVFG
jgi:Icc-related predicted phosphoesterase